MSDIGEYLKRQEEWSSRTFGHGTRTLGVTKHIEKEIAEIRAKPHDLFEWVDVIILAMDGYWRHGGSPESLMIALQAKQDKNFSRNWPTPTSEDEAVEHDSKRMSTSKEAGVSAPILLGYWRRQLRELQPGWDGYVAPAISESAISTVEHFATVPCSDGGIQIEIHQDGYDIEIVIAPDGSIASALVCHEIKAPGGSRDAEGAIAKTEGRQV